MTELHTEVDYAAWVGFRIGAEIGGFSNIDGTDEEFPIKNKTQDFTKKTHKFTYYAECLQCSVEY